MKNLEEYTDEEIEIEHLIRVTLKKKKSPHYVNDLPCGLRSCENMEKYRQRWERAKASE